MRIERVDLNGFGRFADRTWELSDGLTVLVGPNEAGKTTLLNAIRALLFGFEATRDGRTWYPPLAGGRRGGRLGLVTAGGERWTVERHGDRGGGGSLAVRAPNGNTGGQETLDRLLAGADKDLFNNVFAFGLSELQTLGSLSGEGVRSRIYGAGTGLGGMSAADLERALRASQDAAFKPRGRDQTLNRLLGAIDGLHLRIAELERDPARFEQLTREAVDLERQRAEAHAGRLAAIERAERARRLIEAQAPAAQLAGLERELADDDTSLDALAEGLEAELDRRLDAVTTAREVLATAEHAVAAARERQTALVVDALLIDQRDEVAGLRDERQAHLGRAADIAALAAVAERRTDELAGLVRRAGGSEGWLLSIDDSVTAVQATRDAEARIAAVDAAVERIRARLDAERGRSEPAQHGEAEHLQPEDVAARLAAVRELDDLRIRTAILDGQARMAAAPRFPLRTLIAVGIGAPAGLGGLIVGQALGFGPWTLLLMLGLATAAAALGWVIAGPRTGPVAFSHGELGRLERRRAELLVLAGIPPGASDAAVATARDVLVAAQADYASRERRRAAGDERRVALDRLERELVGAQDAASAARDRWAAWLAERGFEPGTTPEAARQILALVAPARAAATDRRDAHARHASALELSDRFERRLDALLEALGRPAPTAAELRPAAVVALGTELEAALADVGRRRDLDAALPELEAEAGRARGRLADRERALDALLRESGCSDPEALRGRARVAASRRRLLAEARELRATLAGIAGDESRLPALLADAASADPAALTAEREDAESIAADLEREERDLSMRAGELRAELAQLERADELGTRRQELAALDGQAAAAARAWASRAIALRLLEETRRNYERERQPLVVRDAERYFERITGGAYIRIIAPPGEDAVRVEPPDGATPKVTDELSRGTAEQLYLALRFGLIEQFARQAEPLPVVMDDILVNFDPERGARAAQAIGELARRHQVLYFTCHEPAAAMLDEGGERTQRLS